MPYSVTIWRAIVGGAVDVVLRTGGGVGEDQLLRGAAAEQHRELVDELAARHEELVLGGERERVPEGATTRDDRDLVHRVRVRAARAPTSACPPSWNAITRFSRSEINRLRRSGPAITRSIASSSCGRPMSFRSWRAESNAASFTRLARSAPVKPGRAARDDVEIDTVRERLAACVHREDRLAPFEVGTVDDDLAIEATRTQERGVEDVGTVRGGEEDDALLLVEAVHLDEELVERLLTLVVTAAEPRAPVTADRVDLVDEHDRGRRVLRLLEQVADADAPTPTNISTKSEPLIEKNGTPASPATALARGLAGPGRAEQQHALRDLGAHVLELGGRGEEVLDLLRAPRPLRRGRRHRERDLRLVLADELGARLAEAHHAAAAALHLAEDRQQHQCEQQERQEAELAGSPTGLGLLVGRDLPCWVDDFPRDRLGVVSG